MVIEVSNYCQLVVYNISYAISVLIVTKTAHRLPIV